MSSSPTPPPPPPRDHTPSPTSEYFDLLTSDGVPLHRSKLRAHVHRDGDWHRSVHVWIIHSTRRHILLQLRAGSKDSFPSHWDVSCAGHLSAGETSLPAALAELSEEVGLTPPPDALHLLTSMKREVISQGGAFIDREFVDVYYTLTDREADEMVLQAEEVEAVRWVEVADYVTRLEAGEPGYVPYPDLPIYRRDVFDALARICADLPGQRGGQKGEGPAVGASLQGTSVETT